MISIRGLLEENLKELMAVTADQGNAGELKRLVAQDDPETPFNLWHIIIDPCGDVFEFNTTIDNEDLYLNIRTKSYDVTWSCPKTHFSSIILT